jgi:hypothetical protein
MTSGSSVRPAIAGSTATSCRPPPSRPPRQRLGCRQRRNKWLATKASELDRRLKRFARWLQRDEPEGVEFRDGRLQVSPVKATITPEARAFADVIEAMMPRVRITELLHEVNRATGYTAAFTNLRTGERCDEENALLAAILPDATNLGLGRMAAASHGVTHDKLVWTADAYIRRETYKQPLPGSSMRTMCCRSRRSGETAEPLLRIGNSSAPPSAATPLARSTHVMDTIPASASTPTSRTSTARTARALCRRRATKRHTCSMG